MHVAECLSSSTRCHASSSCAPQPRSCLTTPIPLWHARVDYSRIKCCFRCCLLYWIEKLGLDANEAHWWRRNVSFFVTNGGGGQRKPGAPAPIKMQLDWILLTRFALGRFAHFLAVENRDWTLLNESMPRAMLRGPQFRVPRAHSRRANGSLIVLNGWRHSEALLARIASSLPAGPLALLYGDDKSWRADEMLTFQNAMGGNKRLVRHFAMNVDADAVNLPHVTQVPIGLNGASVDLPAVLDANGKLQASSKHREKSLLCCCMRAWPHRIAAFDALRAAGHTHCNLTERRPYTSLMHSFLRHRFVVSPHGHGRTDFRVFEALAAGAIPVVDYYPEHDQLFDGLPIVRVTDWEKATPEFLDGEWVRIQKAAKAGTLSWTKAFLPYWFAQLTAHVTPAG